MQTTVQVATKATQPPIEEFISKFAITCSETVSLLKNHQSTISKAGIKRLDGQGASINAATEATASELFYSKESISVAHFEEKVIILMKDSLVKNFPNIKVKETDSPGVLLVIANSKNRTMKVGSDPFDKRQEINIDFNRLDNN